MCGARGVAGNVAAALKAAALKRRGVVERNALGADRMVGRGGVQQLCGMTYGNKRGHTLLLPNSA